MKVSIITVTYNSEQTLGDTIESVITQKYPDVEYIVIDGKSTDDTQDIIDKYRQHIDVIRIEEDLGIYDALNKGILLAEGDIIGILHSDDVFANDSVLNSVVEGFEETNADCLYGDLIFVDSKDKDLIIRYWQPGEYIPGSFSRGWHPPHTTFFVKKGIYRKYGLYDIEYPVSADFELMLRFYERFSIHSIYISEPITKMRMGGKSTGSIKNIIRGNIDCIKAFKKNNMPVPPFYLFRRLYPKLKQLVVKPKTHA